MSGAFNPPLRVVRFIASRAADPERGPKVWLNAAEARLRLLSERELVWVHGPRRHELAEVAFDDSLRDGQVVLRDIAGASPSEIVTIVKVNTDARAGRERPA